MLEGPVSFRNRGNETGTQPFTRHAVSWRRGPDRAAGLPLSGPCPGTVISSR